MYRIAGLYGLAIFDTVRFDQDRPKTDRCAVFQSRRKRYALGNDLNLAEVRNGINCCIFSFCRSKKNDDTAKHYNIYGYEAKEPSRNNMNNSCCISAVLSIYWQHGRSQYA